MSRYLLSSIVLAFFLAALLLPWVSSAQNATLANNTSGANLTPSGVPLVNISPVTIISGSGSLTIEDAEDVNYSAYDSIYGQSPFVSVITAQLYLNGKPYNRSDIPVTFTSDNDTIAVLEPLNRTRPSDEHGQAKILLISNNTCGIVNITASTRTSYSYEIHDNCTVLVVGWGTVSGMVTDKYKNGVPFATVALWFWDGEKNVGVLRASDNPQLTNDGSTAAIGTYTFSHVPRASYNLTAEKDGHTYFAMVYMNAGTYTANVAFPDYVFPGLITPTPTAVPVITPVASATQEPSPSASSQGGLPIPGMGAWLTALSILASAGLLARIKKQP